MPGKEKEKDGSFRKISWRLYATAFFISLLLFAAGLFIGIQISQSANQAMRNELDSLRARTTELQLLSLLDENASPSAQLCDFYSAQIASFDKITGDFGARLGYLEKNRGRTDAGVQELKKEFLLMQFRDFLFVQKVSRQCPSIGINAILFFYTNENCPDCTRQGEVGPALKQSNPGKIMIYAFDTDLGSPAAGALLQTYGITSYPSLVVNGFKIEGFVPLEEIKRHLS